MARGTHFWTCERVAGAVVIAIGTVAFLVKANLLQLTIHSLVPAPIVHVWPFALIAAGVALLWAQRRGTQSRSSERNGERE